MTTDTKKSSESANEYRHCLECGEIFEVPETILFEWQDGFCSPLCHAEANGYQGDAL